KEHPVTVDCNHRALPHRVDGENGSIVGRLGTQGASRSAQGANGNHLTEEVVCGLTRPSQSDGRGIDLCGTAQRQAAARAEVFTEGGGPAARAEVVYGRVADAVILVVFSWWFAH